MPTPFEQQKLSENLLKIYISIEDEILLGFAKYVKKHNGLLNPDNLEHWRIRMLSEIQQLQQENLIQIAKKSELAIDEISEILQLAGYKAASEVDGDLAEAVRLGAVITPPVAQESSALLAVLVAYEKQAKETFNLINTTMLNQSQQVYLDIINQTVGQTLTGTITPQQALRKTVREWSDFGVPALIRKDGSRLSTEAYVNMVTRSMSNNVANAMQDTRMDEHAVDLIQISAHKGARPRCFPFQGNIYSRSGTHPKYPPFSSTSYGEPAGLFGVNCGHVKYAFVEGISKPREYDFNKAENDDFYKLTQQQRKLEREIRKAKREKKFFEEIGDTEAADLANKKILHRQKKMRDFIKDSGLPRKYNREQITGSSSINQNRTLENYDKLKQNQRLKEERLANEKKVRNDIRKQIKDGTVSLKIHNGRQEKHIPGTNNFKLKDQDSKNKGYLGTSYLKISLEEIEALIKQYSIKGTPVINRKGEWKNKEIIIDCGKLIGYDVKKDKKIPAYGFVIHYSKAGTHIVPYGGEDSGTP
ncbi:phage minor capsid protein [Cytobacillus kochii]|uniref:phage minor capsid protein n=1 Tax=Cytobacillus kochii TaxID=859143 RepID=UPI002E23532C|nr:phage minor capsid protein [Cytobacillus kochii]